MATKGHKAYTAKAAINSGVTVAKTRRSLFGQPNNQLSIEERIKLTASRKITRDNDNLHPLKVFSPESLEKIVLDCTAPIGNPKIQMIVNTRKSSEEKYGFSFYTPPLYVTFANVTGLGKAGPFSEDNGVKSNTFSIGVCKGGPPKVLKEDPLIAKEQTEFFDGLVLMIQTVQKKMYDCGEIQPTVREKCRMDAIYELSRKHKKSPDVIELDEESIYKEEIENLTLVYWSKLVQTPLNDKSFDEKDGYTGFYVNPKVFFPKPVEKVTKQPDPKGKGKKVSKPILVKSKKQKQVVVDEEDEPQDNIIIDHNDIEAVIKSLSETHTYNQLEYEDCFGKKIPNSP